MDNKFELEFVGTDDEGNSWKIRAEGPIGTQIAKQVFQMDDILRQGPVEVVKVVDENKSA